jgi:hypothetical protein
MRGTYFVVTPRVKEDTATYRQEIEREHVAKCLILDLSSPFSVTTLRVVVIELDQNNAAAIL